MYDSVRNGEIRGVQVGRRIVIPCDVLEELLGLQPGQPSQLHEGVTASMGGPPTASGGSDLNAVYLTGTIARRPELRMSRTGVAVCTLRLAVSRRRRDGQPRSPLHVDVVAFETAAEAAAGYSDGHHVTVIGRLGQRVWTTDDGARRSRFEIIADAIRPTDRSESSPCGN
ncbi:MAG: single-stranded DNA-binding protein [Actinobacteria bacterium]|nr:single-stranded DNA-binding protein [Actinomycetota bacterium]